jgi:ABC-type ATPase with predicted acetyltransferase domain
VPHFDIIRKSVPSSSFRVAKIKGLFDLQNDHNEEHFVGDIELPENWNIGVIVGPSGSGKTTIAKELFGADYFVEPEFKSASVIDDMPEADANIIAHTFNSVGFSSPPSWLKPYEVLSNGEKMRVQLAYAILQNKAQIVFDEYTSVVDRQVAQIGSAAISRAVRRLDRKFVAVACHYDILDWLEPDWVFDTESMTMQKKNSQSQKSNWTLFGKKDSGTYLESIII